MGYALFAQRKLVLDGVVNSIQLQQTQRSDEQLRLSTDTLSLQSKISLIQADRSSELAALYAQLSSTNDSDVRQRINNTIQSKQQEYENKIQQINGNMYLTSIKENAIEMEVKRLDTKLTALQKQLEKIEEAEGKGIEGATPQFNGIG